MPHTLRYVTIAVALLGSAGLAFAADDKMPGSSSGAQTQSGTADQANGARAKSDAMQAQLSLTSSQKQMIAKELSGERAAAASFQGSLGAKVPTSVALYPVPMTVATEIPAVKPYSYAKLQNNDIVLVDPKNRTVTAVIQAQPSTTGSAPATSGQNSGSMEKK